MQAESRIDNLCDLAAQYLPALLAAWLLIADVNLCPLGRGGGGRHYVQGPDWSELKRRKPQQGFVFFFLPC